MQRQINNICIMIPTLNEGRNLTKCLDAISSFKEVYVVDSGSIDDTLKIAELHKASIIKFDWNGKFPKKRNWFLENIPISAEWVLFLDADEILTAESIREILYKTTRSKNDAHFITYNNFFKGKRMRFGIPQRKLSLIRKHLRFEKITDTSFSKYDMEIHEHPIGAKKIGRIKSRVIHHDYKGIEHFITKHVNYAKWEAERFNNISKNTPLNLRQQIKYSLIKYKCLPFIYFILDYFVFGRIIDGRTGLSYSSYKFHYFKMIIDLINDKTDQNK
ncbi:glycosyltransferase family 2 protein [Planktomarina temperata]|nr:glycosyltransferase family 2 protein [Planktomarina temperata]